MNPIPRHTATDRVRAVFRVAAAVLFVLAGVNHFRNPTGYERIIPPIFPARAALVAISGAFEILGGVGLLFRHLRTIAGWGLLALLVAVFPANVYMATAAKSDLPSWVLWARLPFQAVLMAWVYWVAIARRRADALS